VAGRPDYEGWGLRADRRSRRRCHRGVVGRFPVQPVRSACDRPPGKLGHGHGRRDRLDRAVACRQAGLRGSAAQLGGLLYTAPVDSATVHLVVVVEDGARTKETGERGL